MVLVIIFIVIIIRDRGENMLKEFTFAGYNRRRGYHWLSTRVWQCSPVCHCHRWTLCKILPNSSHTWPGSKSANTTISLVRFSLQAAHHGLSTSTTGTLVTRFASLLDREQLTLGLILNKLWTNCTLFWSKSVNGCSRLCEPAFYSSNSSLGLLVGQVRHITT